MVENLYMKLLTPNHGVTWLHGSIDKNKRFLDSMPLSGMIQAFLSHILLIAIYLILQQNTAVLHSTVMLCFSDQGYDGCMCSFFS